MMVDFKRSLTGLEGTWKVATNIGSLRVYVSPWGMVTQNRETVRIAAKAICRDTIVDLGEFECVCSAMETVECIYPELESERPACSSNNFQRR